MYNRKEALLNINPNIILLFDDKDYEYDLPSVFCYCSRLSDSDNRNRDDARQHIIKENVHT